jgi:hypothetical protein
MVAAAASDAEHELRSVTGTTEHGWWAICACGWISFRKKTQDEARAAWDEHASARRPGRQPS